MNNSQLPLATIFDIIFDGWYVESANSIEQIKSAIAIASATGSVGATSILSNTIYPPTFEDKGIKEFAIIKKH